MTSEVKISLFYFPSSMKTKNCHTAPSAYHAPFPMGGRKGRASALQMPGTLRVQYGKGVTCNV